jgi:hypothetical protein
MNKIRRLLDILKEGHQKYGFIGTKAEFEAEGTRRNELIELAILTARADLELTLKIGGCEAISDLQDAKIFGANNIVAPMIETAYALKKFIDATRKLFSDNEIEEINFLYNLETIHAFKEKKRIIEMTQNNQIHGIVFGRVDYCYSKGKNRNAINSNETTEDILIISKLAKENDLLLTVGGGINEDSIPYLIQISKIRLDRFETRKIVFDAQTLTNKQINNALSLAFEFELLWLEHKAEQYSRITNEDKQRIEMLKKRFSLLK